MFNVLLISDGCYLLLQFISLQWSKCRWSETLGKYESEHFINP